MYDSTKETEYLDYMSMRKRLLSELLDQITIYVGKDTDLLKLWLQLVPNTIEVPDLLKQDNKLRWKHGFEWVYPLVEASRIPTPGSLPYQRKSEMFDWTAEQCIEHAAAQSDESTIAEIYQYIAQLYVSQNQFLEAESAYKAVLDIHTRIHPTYVNTRMAIHALAGFYADRNEHAKAEALLRTFLDTMLRIDPLHYRTLSLQLLLANAQRRQKRFLEAEQLIKHVVEQKHRYFLEIDPTLSFMSLGLLYAEMGRKTEVEKYYLTHLMREARNTFAFQPDEVSELLKGLNQFHKAEIALVKFMKTVKMQDLRSCYS